MSTNSQNQANEMAPSSENTQSQALSEQASTIKAIEPDESNARQIKTEKSESADINQLNYSNSNIYDDSNQDNQGDDSNLQLISNHSNSKMLQNSSEQIPTQKQQYSQNKTITIAPIIPPKPLLQNSEPSAKDHGTQLQQPQLQSIASFGYIKQSNDGNVEDQMFGDMNAYGDKQANNNIPQIHSNEPNQNDQFSKMETFNNSVENNDASQQNMSIQSNPFNSANIDEQYANEQQSQEFPHNQQSFQQSPAHQMVSLNNRTNSQGFDVNAIAAMTKANNSITDPSFLQTEEAVSRSKIEENQLDPKFADFGGNLPVQSQLRQPTNGTFLSSGNTSTFMNDSPSKIQANYLGEKIRQQHQQNYHHNQIAQDAQEKLQNDQQNIFKKTQGSHHQNSGSVAADFGQMISNSFDRQNMRLQVNLDNKNRCKSSTRVNQISGQIMLSNQSNNSNNDSASNLLNHLFNPSIEMSSPKENMDNNLTNWQFSQNENMPQFTKQRSFQVRANDLNQSNNAGQEVSAFGPVIQKQNIKYHKNSVTNRGDSGQNQGKLQTLLKLNQLQQIQMQKLNSYQGQSGGHGTSQRYAPLKSPNTMTAQISRGNANLMLSAHSNNRKFNQLNIVGQTNGSNNPGGVLSSNTRRSQRSQNSGGTLENNTNRGEILSQQQRSPNMSDIQDPYAYYNFHQQHQSVITPNQMNIQNVKPSLTNISVDMKRLDTQQINGADAASVQAQITPKDNLNQVKTCRPKIYNKKMLIISQRDINQQNGKHNQEGQQTNEITGPNQVQNQFADKCQQNQHMIQSNIHAFTINQNSIQQKQQNATADGQNQQFNSNRFSTNQSRNEEKSQNSSNQNAHQGNVFEQQQSSIPIVTTSKIMQSAQQKQNFNENYYVNQQQLIIPKTNDRDQIYQKHKGIVGFIGSAGSGSRGSNFNSSASTFQAGPIHKLQDVKNPQKLMSFRFANKLATKLTEISTFKNLQELDVSGNCLQQQVKELCELNFLKRLNLSNNQITDAWIMPSSTEILNLSYNSIRIMPQEVCQLLTKITTLEISNNKLESFENFNYMHRMKRLLAKNNYVSKLFPIQTIENIYEVDLEGNAIDSHKDFLQFIRNKNDLIIFNLYMNPLMVEVNSIEKLNDDLIQKAPDMITKKTPEEIEEIRQLLRIDLVNYSNALNSHVFTQNNSSMDGKMQGSTAKDNSKGGDDGMQPELNLIEELQNCLTFFKNGSLYRNKRVFNKIRQMQLKSKRSISNNSNSSYSMINNPSIGGVTGGMRASAMFSPILCKKSQRYEDVEAAFDYIVEQEELKRLKQKKILAKKRKIKKKQMMSQIEVSQGDQTAMINKTDSYEDDSDNNTSDFSDDFDDDDDYLDDFDDSQQLNLLDRDDTDKEINGSCMIENDSSRIDYLQIQNQQLHQDEVVSQTITSDLDADMDSYKKIDKNLDYYLNIPTNEGQNREDNDIPNGSTAGFGKKLREINEELQNDNQCDKYSTGNSPKGKQQNPSYKQQSQSAKKEKIDKQIFDLNLSQLNKPQKLQVNQQKKKQKRSIDERPSDMKQGSLLNSQALNLNTKPSQYIIEQERNRKKQIKTVQNSNESSQNSESNQQLIMNDDCDYSTNLNGGIGTIANSNDDRKDSKADQNQQLNQSFSLKNIQVGNADRDNNNIEVESLMMNKVQMGQQYNRPSYEASNVPGPPGNNPPFCVLINSHQSHESLALGNANNSTQNRLKESQSQNIKAQTHNLLKGTKEESGNQSLNQSIVADSMQQSMVSGTQNSKKTAPNFKLDLSKCKYEIDEINSAFEFDVESDTIDEESNNKNIQIENLQIGSMVEKGESLQSQDDPIELSAIMIDDKNFHKNSRPSISKEETQYKDQENHKYLKSESKPPSKGNQKPIIVKIRSPNGSQAKKIHFNSIKTKNKISPEKLDKIRKSKDYNIVDKKAINEKEVEMQQNEKHGSNTVRDPMLLIKKSRKGELQVDNQNETQTPQGIAGAAKHIHRTERDVSPVSQIMKEIKSDKIPNCPNCYNYKKILDVMRQAQLEELNEITREVKQYQKTFNDIKTNFNLIGEIEFSNKGNQKSSEQSAKIIKITKLPEMIFQIFRRIYQDLNKLKDDNMRYAQTQKELQLKIKQLYSQLEQQRAHRVHKDIHIPHISQIEKLKEVQHQLNIPQPPKTTTYRHSKKKSQQSVCLSAQSAHLAINNKMQSKHIMDKSDEGTIIEHTDQTDHVELMKQDYILQQDMMGTGNTFKQMSSIEFNSPHTNLNSQLDSHVRYSNVYNQTQQDDINDSERLGLDHQPKINGKEQITLHIKKLQSQKGQDEHQKNNKSTENSRIDLDMNKAPQIVSKINIKQKHNFRIENISNLQNQQYEPNTFSNRQLVLQSNYQNIGQCNSQNVSQNENYTNEQIQYHNMNQEGQQIPKLNNLNKKPNSYNPSMQGSSQQINSKKVMSRNQSKLKQQKELKDQIQIVSKSYRNNHNQLLNSSQVKYHHQQNHQTQVQNQLLRNQSTTSRGKNGGSKNVQLSMFSSNQGSATGVRVMKNTIILQKDQINRQPQHNNFVNDTQESTDQIDNCQSIQFSYSMRQHRAPQNIQVPLNLNQMQQQSHLQKSLESIKNSQQVNYKTSRVPFPGNSNSLFTDPQQKGQVIKNDPNEQQKYIQIAGSINIANSSIQKAQNYGKAIQNEFQIENNQEDMSQEQRQQLQNQKHLWQSYSTQRKQNLDQQIEMKLDIYAENQTQRLQSQQLFNQSGGGYKFTNSQDNWMTNKLKQKQNQLSQKKPISNSRVQSANMMAMDQITNDSNNKIYQLYIANVNTHSEKRPQSVVEASGRRFQKIQQQHSISVNKKNSRQRKSRQEKKVKNKSAERKSSKANTANSINPKYQLNNQIIGGCINIQNQGELNQNLSTNIENIQQIQKRKFSVQKQKVKMNYNQNRLSLTKQQLKNVQLEGSQFTQTDQKLQSPHIFDQQQNQQVINQNMNKLYNDSENTMNSNIASNANTSQAQPIPQDVKLDEQLSQDSMNKQYKTLVLQKPKLRTNYNLNTGDNNTFEENINSNQDLQLFEQVRNSSFDMKDNNSSHISYNMKNLHQKNTSMNNQK